MTPRSRAFVGLGSNLGDRQATLETALARLGAISQTSLAAVSAAYENPAVGGPPQPDYVNAVAELSTSLSPRALFLALRGIEDLAHRVRAERDGPRTLDLDLLALGDLVMSEPELALPHPRALDRAFTLGPWAEIAPEYVPAGTRRSVASHAATLRGQEPGAYLALRRTALLVPARSSVAVRRPIVLADRRALASFRAASAGSVGFVPTMGALHEGHAALARRARAASDVVIASIFVNPLQFGPNEDLSRYPRTFEADLDLLGREGVNAVYAPSREDLYPSGFSTSIDVRGVTERFEGAIRPGHFRGVATVVAKLLARVRPDRTWFGRKDAQQVALVERMSRDLDLPGEIVVAPTVRDVDGLALSSRNRFLSGDDRVRALALPRALRAASDAAARGVSDRAALVAVANAVLLDAGLAADYLELVDPATFESRSRLADDGAPGAPAALLVAAVRVGTTRLLDNEWLATPASVAVVA